MKRILSGFAVAIVVLLSQTTASSVARADTWGCSAEKCLVVCQKAGGQRCSAYCDKELRDKKVAGICK
jgi:hypothetical protein